MKVRNIVFIAAILALHSLSFSPRASAIEFSPNTTQLDLGSLANFDYAGSDSMHSSASCRLVASTIRPDFSGRMIQDFRIWTDNRTDINFNFRLKGPDRIRDGKSLDSHRTQFTIVLDSYNLDIISDAQNTATILEFKLSDTSGVSGNPTQVMNCQSVKATPRQ